jgi:hypothetical protein
MIDAQACNSTIPDATPAQHKPRRIVEAERVIADLLGTPAPRKCYARACSLSITARRAALAGARFLGLVAAPAAERSALLRFCPSRAQP